MSAQGVRVLVTGASGFIGHHVIKNLQVRKCEIHGISRYCSTGYSEGIQWWRADLTNPRQTAEVVENIKPERIIHLASMVTGNRSIDLVLPLLYMNLVSSVALLVAAARTDCKRVLLAGSMEEPVSGQSLSVPGSPYAAAKWAASGYAKMFHRLYGVSTVVLRIFMTYGPGQSDYTKLVPYVVRSILQGESPELGSGKRAVDWIFVDDLADGIVRACFADDIDGMTIDLGSGTLVSIKEFVTRLARIVNPSIPLSFGAIPDRPLEQETCADVAATEAVLGWCANTSLEVGFERTVLWYREQM